jgi:hypothetical protein
MRMPVVFLSSLVLAHTAVAESPPTVVLENPFLRYTISREGNNVSFINRATGTDYLRFGPPSPSASVRLRGKDCLATSAQQEGDRLTLVFGEVGVTASLRTEGRPYAVLLRVESVSGPDVESLTFLNAPLSLEGAPGEAFGACALSLNLFTRVDALPALQSELRASCEKKFGIVGARVAIVAGPMGRMLPLLQQTLSGASELPVCKVAGPWANEIPFNHGSYLFNFGSLTETNVDEWIDMAHSLGFTQIDNHGGSAFFRFGDMELNRKKWPEGWDTWSRIVARLHDAGIGSIFHTYAFFIDKQSKYVTPVPDPRLDAFRTFTLAEPLSADASEITVNESTKGTSTITGFFEHNSVMLHIGEELVTFAGVSQQAPWRFTGVKRGAFGTRAAEHERGAQGRHLKECFGLFVPNPESSLFEEIAANHAEVVNRCNFDGIYLDAIDGSSILRGGDERWYWADKFVVEIQKRLKRPVGMEMSSMWHHFWQYRTRWQAWDYPQRGQKRFIDLHAQSVNGGLLLPLHLGWWNFQSFNPPQVEPSYPDVMEDLGAKLIGWDAGISLTGGVDREALHKSPLFRRAVDILRTCEELRHAGSFDEATKAKLREPGREFALVTDGSGKPRFRRSEAQSQTICKTEPWTLSWRVTNSFQGQPLKLRIEALMSAAAPGSTNALEIGNGTGAKTSDWKESTADGVRLTWSPSASSDEVAAMLIATNTGKVAREAAWARLERRFDPTLNLKDHQALGVEVESDGSGALLALRLESPQHIAFGAVADRYVTLDSTGRRTFTLVETESTRWSDFVWNDGKSIYNTYREAVDFKTIESVSVWLQNLPSGREAKCRIGAIRAVGLETGLVKNPRIQVNGRTIEFPAELKSGSWIECNRPADCAIYDRTGGSMGKVTPRGDWPRLDPGVTTLEFLCDSGSGPPPRARVTTFILGDQL